MKKSLIYCCLLLLPFGIQGQTKWSLRHCIDHAVENNIEIKQQVLSVKSSEIDLSTSKNSRLPDLNSSFGQNFNFGRTVALSNNTVTSGDTGSTSFSIGTSIPLFTGFRISNEIKMNELNLLAATEGLKKAKENLELQITSLYLDVLFKKEIVKVYIEQLELSKRQLEKTNVLVASGKLPESQRYDINAQLAKDELNVTMANNDLALSLLNITQALNLVQAEAFDIVEPTQSDVVGDNIASILPPAQIYETAIAIKPHIKEAEYKLDSSKKSRKIAESGYWPKLNMSMNYGTGFDHVYTSGAVNSSISDQLSRNQSKSVGFSLSVPIFNRFQVRNQVRAANLDIENKELMLDNIKLALFKEIQQAYQSATAAQMKYTATEKSYLSAKEALKYAQERYDIGKSTVFEFNDAQTKLLSSKSEQLQAKYDFLFRAKILDFYNGKEIDIR